jgi:hypothetical protein
MKNATRILVSTIGFISGFFGIEHGIGEFLQGNIKPSDLIIQAWPNSSLFNIIGGEPAMTIIPNMQITGIFAIIVSSLVAIWSLFFVQNKYGGLILIILSIIQLLVGGGIAPIFQLIVVGIAAFAINSKYTWIRKYISDKIFFFAEKVWIWIFITTVILCLTLFPGSIILGQLFPKMDPAVIANLSQIYLLFLLLAVIFSFGHDVSIMGHLEDKK